MNNEFGWTPPPPAGQDLTPPPATGEGREPAPVDMKLVHRLHQLVGDRLQLEQSARKARGQGPLSGDGKQAHARKLINDVIREHAVQLLSDGEPPLDADEDLRLQRAIFASMFGAGQLQSLLDDVTIENIDINGCDEVWIRRADGTRSAGTPVAPSDAELVLAIQTLASYAGRSARYFDEAHVELDLRLPDGSRLSAVQSVSGRPAISIRRHRFAKVGLADLVGNDTLTKDAATFLAAAVKARYNVLISGATNSGKTTMLRALASEIGPEERIVTVENSLELGLRADRDRHPDCVELEAREANSEGAGEVTMAQLVRRSLRMNPDRIIVGEALGPEIITMLSAMSQGNDGSLSTLHARTARESFERISTYALTSDTPMPREGAFSLVAGGLDFIIFLEQDRGTGKRRLKQVLEVAGYDPSLGSTPSASEIFMPGDDGIAAWTGVMPSRASGLTAAGWAPGGEWS